MKSEEAPEAIVATVDSLDITWEAKGRLEAVMPCLRGDVTGYSGANDRI